MLCDRLKCLQCDSDTSPQLFCRVVRLSLRYNNIMGSINRWFSVRSRETFQPESHLVLSSVYRKVYTATHSFSHPRSYYDCTIKQYSPSLPACHSTSLVVVVAVQRDTSDLITPPRNGLCGTSNAHNITVCARRA